MVNKTLLARPAVGRVNELINARGPLSAAKSSDAVVDFSGHAVVADHRTGIAQPAGLALDHETPQRVAGILHQSGIFRVPSTARAAMVGQSRERGLQRAAQPAQRGGLLLRDFVVERAGTLWRT